MAYGNGDNLSADLFLLENSDDISNSEILEVIVKYTGDIFSIVSAEKGLSDILIELLDENYAIITLRKEQLQKLYDFPEIEYIELPKILTFMSNLSNITSSLNLNRTCVTQVQNDPVYNLRGEGVIIGIIDSGIDYTHRDFITSGGKSRVLYTWDQTDMSNQSPPEGFIYGTEYTNEQINEALNSAYPFSVVPPMDSIGHGTAVAGIAAGNGSGSRGYRKGVAPEASIIAVKLGQRGEKYFARTTEISRAIKYLYGKAQELNMPLAINLSFGTSNGSHDGSSLFETYVGSMAQKWKSAIIVASGNEGAAGHHFAADIQQGESLTVEFVTVGYLESMYITMWKNFVDIFSLQLVAPNGQISGVLNAANPIVRMNVGGTATVSMAYGQPTHYNESQEIFFSFEGRGRYIMGGIWRIIVRGIQVTDGNFNIWLPTSDYVTSGTAFLRPSAFTTLTIPSTVPNVITVGGYNSIINAIADFSGRGYTRNDMYIKPDLVAPAVNVISTKINGGYDSFSGTSMAAPFVTGAAALMMEWGVVRNNDPFLYGQRVKAFLHRGAQRSTRLTYPNPLWGYGILCLKNTMDYLIQSPNL